MINNGTVVITGADGLLGRRVTQLLSNSLRVYALVRVLPEKPVPDINYVIADFGGDWSFSELPERIDYVIHFAQSSQFRNFPDGALDVFNVNVSSTARLLDHARKTGVKTFIYASSGGVYGNGSEAFKENSAIVPPGQLGYYLGSKACGEILVQSYASIFKVIVLRPFFMYGPGQNRSMLIPRLIDSVATGKPVMLQGEQGLRINPVHVDDAALAVIAALDVEESSAFNIAGPQVMSLKKMCEDMGEHLQKMPLFIQQPGDAHDLIADISLMSAKLHVPVRRLIDNLNDMVIKS